MYAVIPLHLCLKLSIICILADILNHHSFILALEPHIHAFFVSSQHGIDHVPCGYSSETFSNVTYPPCQTISLVLQQISNNSIPDINLSGHIFIESGIYQNDDFSSLLSTYFQEIVIEGIPRNNNTNDIVLENFIHINSKSLKFLNVHFQNVNLDSMINIATIYFEKCNFRNVTIDQIISIKESQFIHSSIFDSSLVLPFNTTIDNCHLKNSSILSLSGNEDWRDAWTFITRSTFQQVIFQSRFLLQNHGDQSKFRVSLRECEFLNSELYLSDANDLVLLDSSMNHTRCSIVFTTLVHVSRCTVTGNSFLSFASINKLVISHSQFNKCQGPVIGIYSSLWTHFKDCQFIENRNTPITTNGVASLLVDLCTFSHNRGGALHVKSGVEFVENTLTQHIDQSLNSALHPTTMVSISNSFGMSVPSNYILRTQVSINLCTFLNNSNNQEGGALYFENVNPGIFQCNFTDNYSERMNGGAVASYGNHLEVTQSTFVNNRAYLHGGAIYLSDALSIIDSNMFSNGPIATISDENDKYLYSNENLFESNKAFKGGALYVQLKQVKISNQQQKPSELTCVNNLATYSGGCLFIETVMNSIQFTIISKGNTALSYGPLIGRPLNHIKYEMRVQYEKETHFEHVFNNDNIPQLKLYPGQKVSKLEISIWNEPFEKVNFLSRGIQMKLKNSLISNNITLFQVVMNPPILDIPMDQPFLLTLNEVNQTLSLLNLSLASMKDVYELVPLQLCLFQEPNTHSMITIDMNLQILSCPSDKILDGFTIYGGVCIDIPKPRLDIIIPLVIVAMCLSSMIIPLCYACKVVIERLYRLHVKEKSEKQFEKVLNSTKDSLFLIDHYNNTINQKNSNDRDYSMEEFTHLSSVPLLSMEEKKELYSMNERNDSDEWSLSAKWKRKNKYLKSNSYVIPIEEIQVNHKIGEGSNGAVYHAIWNGCEVALKTLKEDLFIDNDEFEKEAALLSSLRHPNIVNLLGVCISSNSSSHRRVRTENSHRKCMIQEYLSKGTLEKLILDCKRGIQSMTFTQKVEILLGVAKGMAYLHGLKPKPVIHRDLKPANILLDQSWTSKVCDFGLSKIMGTNTSTTASIGTFYYMANEMIDGTENYNEKVDVYSFGIIMWELFFEENPYNSCSEKLYKFHKLQIQLGGLSIIFQVSKGLRPFIPFWNDEEQFMWTKEFIPQELRGEVSLEQFIHVENVYLDLMKQCWNGQPENRPPFLNVIDTLKRCHSMMKISKHEF
ncbi:hypothetical protein C9374_001708 [Naegleria lovaniensis]|uniref:Protein kinase domain-containing protein n=1 Tax=Naegleria lovaniensis TaxID=51637 RepID=A0AA88GS38_NAELO|nr:uncharacterized protein C9374_001708 [Naegleria lovaniensis]KAG2387376.1 hypothetical protein C9374_001708 [Naegleria lovaniensis]